MTVRESRRVRARLGGENSLNRLRIDGGAQGNQQERAEPGLDAPGRGHRRLLGHLGDDPAARRGEPVDAGQDGEEDAGQAEQQQAGLDAVGPGDRPHAADGLVKQDDQRQGGDAGPERQRCRR